MKKSLLTFRFEVFEDITSELAAEYQDLIIDALAEYQAKANPEEQKKIDKLFYDYARQEPDQKVDPVTHEIIYEINEG